MLCLERWITISSNSCTESRATTLFVRILCNEAISDRIGKRTEGRQRSEMPNGKPQKSLHQWHRPRNERNASVNAADLSQFLEPGNALELLVERTLHCIPQR
jgi:hypothetical protein